MASSLLAASLVLSSESNTTSTEEIDDFSGMGPTDIISTVYSGSPETENNFIPTAPANLRAEVETDNIGNYRSISVDLPLSVINLNPQGRAATDGQVCNERNECVGGYHAFFEIPVLDKFPYRTIQLNWNPQGHFPMSFEANHFDYHFHTQTLAELKTMTAGICGAEHFSCEPELMEKVTRQLPAEQVPAGYTNAALDTSVAWMGSHLVAPPTIPASADQFTQIFIHGAYEGRLSFQEPMITVAYFNELKTRTQRAPATEDCFAIPQPLEYPDDKVYPREWCARYVSDGDLVRVSLERFPQHITESQSGSAVKVMAGSTVFLLVMTLAVLLL